MVPGESVLPQKLVTILSYEHGQQHRANLHGLDSVLEWATAVPLLVKKCHDAPAFG